MAYKDLREWIAVLDKSGELQKVEKEVDWNLEVGAITRRVYDLKAPAPLFQNIKGYPEGYRILAAPIGLSARNKYARIALALDMPVESTVRDIVEEYLKRKKKTIPPVVIQEGSCQENILMDKDVDLFQFPVPMVHDGDGGRYIGTWHTVITKDPETEWVNYGMYRNVIHDRNHIGTLGLVEHLGLHYQKYVDRNEPMEFAIAIGTEPVTALVSATTIPAGVNEADVVGAIRGEPLEVVRCKTVDICVPATSEIVLEGYFNPQEMRDEGPFGEYTGYEAGGVRPMPVGTITAVTHRDAPILTMTAMGVPVDDCAVILPISMSAVLLEELRDIKQFPVDFVHVPSEGISHICVVSSKVPYQAYPKTLAMNIWATKVGNLYGNIIIVVNDDVDITNIGNIMWALATRVHPDRGIWKVPNTFSVPLLPWLNPEEKKKRLGARVLIDATWPADWPIEWIPRVSAFETIWPKSVQTKVISSWNEYGFK